MTRRKPNPIELARLVQQMQEALGQSDDPANDDIDEEALRELARHDAEQMKRARKR